MYEVCFICFWAVIYKLAFYFSYSNCRSMRVKMKITFNRISSMNFIILIGLAISTIHLPLVYAYLYLPSLSTVPGRTSYTLWPSNHYSWIIVPVQHLGGFKMSVASPTFFWPVQRSRTTAMSDQVPEMHGGETHKPRLWILLELPLVSVQFAPVDLRTMFPASTVQATQRAKGKYIYRLLSHSALTLNRTSLY